MCWLVVLDMTEIEAFRSGTYLRKTVAPDGKRMYSSLSFANVSASFSGEHNNQPPCARLFARSRGHLSLNVAPPPPLSPPRGCGIPVSLD